MNAPHTKSVENTLAELHSSPAGLSSAEAANRLQSYGPNELLAGISRPAWRMLLAQFIEPLILILVAAAALSFVLGNLTEGGAILAIVILFGLLGFFQEYRAEKAMAALKQLSCPTVRVRRDGDLRVIPARDLVPGDIVLLEAGNIVPADLRLVFCVNCGFLESPLTGEAEHIHKHPDTLKEDNLPLGDRTNLAFMGTSIAHGRGSGVVVETGMRTELGKITAMLHGIESGHTPLQRKLAQVGKTLSLAGLFAAGFLLIFGMVRGESFPIMLLTSVSLLVAVVPEGLPAVITVTLALGGRRMLKRHALIRKLRAVETLGSVTIICTDKTGTLTENLMTVTHVQTLHRDLSVPGGGTNPGVPSAEDALEVAPLLLTAALCNDAQLVLDETGNPPHMIGDPTETALLVAANRFGIHSQSLVEKMPRITEFPFDSTRKRMTTLHRGDQCMNFLPEVMAAPVLAAVKGAPDQLLSLAKHILDNGRIEPLTHEIQRRFLADNERMASEGLRVIGVAFRRLESLPGAQSRVQDVEANLVFCGLVGIMDPPRDAVRTAIARSHAANIKTLMITGDHPFTAAAIARNLLLAPDGEDPRVLTGTELAALSDSELEEHAEHITVYARVSPEDKLRIVAALQKRGHVVAMTGDGVNDAPALKRAEIGVAMGITGTDVAKESSEMILLDDNFSTIVAAIEEGRTIYDNLVRFIKFSLGGNLGKVLVMMLAPLFGIGPLALRPLHLLWLNLLTDGLMGSVWDSKLPNPMS